MSDVGLLAKMGTDPAKWTDEFLERFPEGTNDWGTLVGWFANAIESGERMSQEIQNLSFFQRGSCELCGEGHHWSYHLPGQARPAWLTRVSAWLWRVRQ